MARKFKTLGFQIGGGVAVLLILLTAALFVPLFGQTRAAMLTAAAERQDTSMNVLLNEMARAQDLTIRTGPDGRVTGAVAPSIIALDDHSLIDRVGAISGETATVFVWDDAAGDFFRRSTNIIKDDGQRAVGTPLGRENPVHAAMLRNEVYRGEATILGRRYLTVYVPVQTPAGAPLGILYVGVSKASLNATVQGMLFSGLVVAAVSLAGFMMLTFLALRRMLAPLGHLESAVRAVRDQRYDIVVPHTDRPDAIGGVARSVDAFRHQLQEAETLRHGTAREEARRLALFDTLRSAMEALKDGHVDTRIDAGEWRELGDKTQELCANFNGLAQAFGALVDQMHSSIAAVKQGADDLKSLSDDMSMRAQTQAATLEQSAAALHEMSGTVEASAARAKSANDLARDNRKRAESGSAVMERALAAMSNIARSSDEITNIIGVIDDIAFQTNLLALNAGVEAARAGEAGKGFAFIAAEVRTLAQRASESAREIKDLVRTSAGHVESGEQLMQETHSTFSAIVQGAGSVTSLIAEMAASAQEHATGVREINSGVSDLDRVSQENAHMVMDINSTIERLTRQAEQAAMVIAGFLGKGRVSPRTGETPAPFGAMAPGRDDGHRPAPARNPANQRRTAAA